MIRKNSDTVESLRKLISVPPEIEARLRAYAGVTPVAGREIEMSLRFRKRVLVEFEQLIFRRSSVSSQSVFYSSFFS
jgi:hypothetical protein